jgi:SAM-dependent methyltransferase
MLNMTPHDEYLNPLCSATTLDNFGLRRAILNSLTRYLNSIHGTVLDIGCGSMPYRSLLMTPPARIVRYIGMDLKGSLPGPDLEWDGRTIPLRSESVDQSLATEVLEHVPEPGRLLAEVNRVLRPGGGIFFTVPFLWPLHCMPGDEYRYTPFSLARHLEHSGFENIRLEALGGWDASLAQMIGLWIVHRPMSSLKRGILSRAAIPAVKYLMRRDQAPSDFKKGLAMITGIAGTARKSGIPFDKGAEKRTGSR